MSKRRYAHDSIRQSDHEPGPAHHSGFRPAGKGADLDLPAAGRFGVANRSQVGQGLELGDEPCVRQSVQGRFREVGHRPQAQGAVVARTGDPAQIRGDGDPGDGSGREQVPASRIEHELHGVESPRDLQHPDLLAGPSEERPESQLDIRPAGR